MLFFIWPLLNLAIAIFFFINCFRATKLLKEKIGWLPAIVLVLGLLSFMGKSRDDKSNREPDSNRIKTWNFSSPDSLDMNSESFAQKVVGNARLSKYILIVNYRKERKTSDNIPVSANAITNGLALGTAWTPLSIVVNRTGDDSRFSYHVVGMREWTLLGIKIYNESTDFQGLLPLE